jgi:hypothetical protein
MHNLWYKTANNCNVLVGLKTSVAGRWLWHLVEILCFFRLSYAGEACTFAIWLWSVGDMKPTGKSEIHRGKSVPTLLCLPQISRGLNSKRIRYSQLRGRRLTAWDVPQPVSVLYLVWWCSCSVSWTLGPLTLHFKYLLNKYPYWIF